MFPHNARLTYWTATRLSAIERLVLSLHNWSDEHPGEIMPDDAVLTQRAGLGHPRFLGDIRLRLLARGALTSDPKLPGCHIAPEGLSALETGYLPSTKRRRIRPVLLRDGPAVRSQPGSRPLDAQETLALLARHGDPGDPVTLIIEGHLEVLEPSAVDPGSEW